MSAPKRIQLRRTKGWRKPEGAIVVSRPSKWGNPLSLSEIAEIEQHDNPRLGQINDRSARHFAVEWFRTWLAMPEAAGLLASLTELRGHDLACWCPLDQPCHADVLLELANGGAP